MERLLDIFFSVLAIFLLSPFLICVALLLKFSAEGEVFYLQERIGKGRKSFKLLKFVTMLKDSPNVGTGTITMKNDPRVLPMGKILRKTKINELPQLFNVLCGQMSIIGPRPLTYQTFLSYSETIKLAVGQVKPGLSGVGSIIFRDEENIMSEEMASVDFYDNIIAPYKGALEVWFVSNKSVYLYFILIGVTVWTLFFPKTQLPWRVFPDLPEPPKELKSALNYKCY